MVQSRHLHRRQELQHAQAAADDGTAFLLACLADARQELMAQQGRDALAGLGGGPRSSPQERTEAAHQPAEQGSRPQQLRLQVLSLAQREAVLQRLLDRLHVDWSEREGLVLPTSGAPRSRSPGASPAAAGQEGGAASPAPVGGCGSASQGCAVQACRSASATKGSPSKSELLELVQSEVRPWGG